MRLSGLIVNDQRETVMLHLLNLLGSDRITWPKLGCAGVTYIPAVTMTCAAKKKCFLQGRLIANLVGFGPILGLASPRTNTHTHIVSSQKGIRWPESQLWVMRWWNTTSDKTLMMKQECSQRHSHKVGFRGLRNTDEMQARHPATRPSTNKYEQCHDQNTHHANKNNTINNSRNGHSTRNNAYKTLALRTRNVSTNKHHGQQQKHQYYVPIFRKDTAEWDIELAISISNAQDSDTI